MLHTATSLPGQAVFTTYLEADFLQPAGQAPWRWRQYWGELSLGKWRLLGGQGWSLLRPNRFGIESDNDLLNTLVVEPAYHVGLTGARRRQVRLTRDLSHGNTAAFEWESGGRFQAKMTHDWGRRAHVEGALFTGTRNRLGFGISQVMSVKPRVRLVGEQFWSRGGGPEMLGILPPGVHAYSVLEGVELPLLRDDITAYAYGGFVYGGRSGGNRFARQYTGGFQKRLFRGPQGLATLNAQFSQVDRALWDGRSGLLTYVMSGVRYAFPAPR